MTVRRAAFDIWGIDGNLEVTEGYDNNIQFDDDLQDGKFTPWTFEQRCELADLMIYRWKRFKEQQQED